MTASDEATALIWYTAWIRECRRVIKDTGCLWTFMSWRSAATFQKASADARWPIESMLVWDKDWIGPGGHKGLRPSYELVALWAGASFAIDDRGLPDIRKEPWSSQKPNGHPAEKPIGLLRWLLDISAKPGAIVADPFCGSGTTLAAAAQAGMEWVGCDLDPAWAAYAQERAEKAAPRTARPDEQQGALFGGERRHDDAPGGVP